MSRQNHFNIVRPMPGKSHIWYDDPKTESYLAYKYVCVRSKPSSYPNFRRTVHVVSFLPRCMNRQCKNMKPFIVMHSFSIPPAMFCAMTDFTSSKTFQRNCYLTLSLAWKQIHSVQSMAVCMLPLYQSYLFLSMTLQ